jgi:hypothetical protein
MRGPDLDVMEVKCTLRRWELGACLLDSAFFICHPLFAGGKSRRIDGPNMCLRVEHTEGARWMYRCERLGRVPARVLNDDGRTTRVLGEKGCNIVDLAFDDDPAAVCACVFLDFLVGDMPRGVYRRLRPLRACRRTGFEVNRPRKKGSADLY